MTHVSRQPTERITFCPACGHEDFKKRFVKMDRHFWRCVNCGLEKQHPLPTLEELQAYYQNAYLSGMYKPFVDAAALKTHTAEHHFKTIRSFCRPGHWLDIGASTGVFVQCARRAGFDAEGIDFTPAAVEQAQAQGIPVHCSTIEAYEPGYLYDNITAFDVLEHVLDPAGFLNSLHRLLKPGGTFAIAVPNQRSVSQRLMGRHWFYYIPEEHLYYYHPNCMRQLLSNAGLYMAKWAPEMKPLSFNYCLIWMKDRYPLVHKLISPLSTLVGERLGELSIPLPVGDMIVLGQRPNAQACESPNA